MKLTQITKIGSLLIVSAALIASAKATPITGEIIFDGTAKVNNGDNLATATAFTAITGFNNTGLPVVVGGTGNYLSTPGAHATFSLFNFSTSHAVNPLWTFTIGATTYSFWATTIQIKTQITGFLNLEGQGWATETGYSMTKGSWTITDTGSGPPLITFGSSATVPDSGATALLIGLGLAGIAAGLVAQRKLVRS